MTDLPLAIDLARMQFAFTVSFHIIFPAFSIGLASYLAVLEALWLKTGRKVYIDLFLASYCGLGISIYPYMVPPSITIWQAAAPDESLMFLLVGAVVLLPIIICYTAYSYWVFRGKTRSGEGYH
ncbi:MAG: cytochrome d ubiquinol oxidase subunit II [Alphaproteobacteria bacterium]